MCVWVQSEGVGGDGDLIMMMIMMILMTMIMIMYLGDDTVTIQGGAQHMAASTHHQCTKQICF